MFSILLFFRRQKQRWYAKRPPARLFLQEVSLFLHTRKDSANAARQSVWRTVIAVIGAAAVAIRWFVVAGSIIAFHLIPVAVIRAVAAAVIVGAVIGAGIAAVIIRTVTAAVVVGAVVAHLLATVGDSAAAGCVAITQLCIAHFWIRLLALVIFDAVVAVACSRSNAAAKLQPGHSVVMVTGFFPMPLLFNAFVPLSVAYSDALISGIRAWRSQRVHWRAWLRLRLRSRFRLWLRGRIVAGRRVLARRRIARGLVARRFIVIIFIIIVVIIDDVI